MKLIRIINVCSLLLVLASAVSHTAIAQKKKRGGEELPQGIRLREAEFYFTEGEKFFILEDYAKALVYYQRALDINPENGTIHYKIADVLAKSTKQEDLLKASARSQGLLSDNRSCRWRQLRQRWL